MEKEKTCEHKLTLPLYARGENNWISSQKLSGKMVYICIKCGALLDRGFVERPEFAKSEKGEVEDE